MVRDRQKPGVGASETGQATVDWRRLRRGLVAVAALALTAAGPPEQVRIGYVIDGDTFRLTSGERIRVAGIDAPETRAGQAKCAREIARGKLATAKARALLDGRAVTIVRVGRSYRRTVARVELGGRDLAAQLVAIGVAQSWGRHRPKPNWCTG